MRCNAAKRILKDHYASQERLGPFDDPCYEPGPGAVIPQRAAELDRHAKRCPSVAAQKVQWGHEELKSNQPGEPQEGRPMPMETVKQDLQPFEEGPPGSLHQARQVWVSTREVTNNEDRVR